MTIFAIAGPLAHGVRVKLQLPGQPRAALLPAQVLSCAATTVVVELDQAPPATEEGVVADLFMPLSWGIYKWLCLASCHPGEHKVELELLDAPVFVQRRLDPRVGVAFPAQVRALRGGRRTAPHDALVTDISRGGLKLSRASMLRTGDRVEVSIQHPGAHNAFSSVVCLLARVVMAYPSPRSTGPGLTDAHLCFLDGQPDALAAIARLVAQQLEGASEERGAS
jgi:hypothetical protein